MTIYRFLKKIKFIYKIFTGFISVFVLMISTTLTGCCQSENENVAEPTKYTLTFNANSRSGEMKSITGNNGTEITLEANGFTKTGYTFSCWNTNEDGSGDKYGDKAKIKLTADMTLYAQWTANTYTVIFDSNGGSDNEQMNIQATYDKEFELPDSPFTKPDYKFAAWNTNEDGNGTDYAAKAKEKNLTEVNDGIVKLYARWIEAESYCIIYVLNGGEHIDTPKTLFNETEDVTLGNAKKLGNTFGGWYETEELTGNKVEGWNVGERKTDVTLYAKWTANNYTVTFDANGGVGSMEPQIFIYENQQTLAANEFTRSGYRFTGWNTNADGSGTGYADAAAASFTADTTLYAQWTANNYTVTFDANGGVGSMEAQTFTYGKQQALRTNEFTRSGYRFSGWNTNADGSGTGYADAAAASFTADTTLYAQWTANNYTVTFDANGGVGSMEAQTFTYGKQQALKANEFTRSGYRFTGWNTNADGSGTGYADAAAASFTADTTLYAKWEYYFLIPDISELNLYKGDKIIGDVMLNDYFDQVTDDKGNLYFSYKSYDGDIIIAKYNGKYSGTFVKFNDSNVSRVRLAYNNSKLYMATNKNVYDITDGNMTEKYSLEGNGEITAFAVNGEDIYIAHGTDSNDVYCKVMKVGEEKQSESMKFITDMIFANGTLYALSLGIIDISRLKDDKIKTDYCESGKLIKINDLQLKDCSQLLFPVRFFAVTKRELLIMDDGFLNKGIVNVEQKNKLAIFNFENEKINSFDMEEELLYEFSGSK